MCPLLTRVLISQNAACRRVEHWDTSAARCIFRSAFPEALWQCLTSLQCCRPFSPGGRREFCLCHFNFHYNDDKLCSGCFRFFLVYWVIIFLKESVFSLLGEFVWFSLSFSDLWNSLRCSGYESFVKFCKYFIPVCGSLSHTLLMVSFDRLRFRN